MHELGIALGVLDLVRQHVPEDSAQLVRQVRVRVGDLAGVVPDSLTFCFDAITAGTPYGSARLSIDRVTPTAQCHDCDRTFACRGYGDRCPDCGSALASLVTGRELQVVDVELDDVSEVRS